MYSIEIFNVLAFVVLINPAGNGVMPEKFDFYCKRIRDFPGSSDAKASAYNARDLGSIPGSRRSPGEGNSSPLLYSYSENPMDRGAWWATVHGVRHNLATKPSPPFTHHNQRKATSSNKDLAWSNK